MRVDDDEIAICPECGEPFIQGESRAKLCGDRSCALARRRRKYHSNPKQRAKDIARAKAWNAKNRVRINAVRKQRTHEGEAPWYRLRADQIPPALSDLRRAYAAFHKRAKRGGKEERQAFAKVAKLMGAARRIRKWTPSDLANLDIAITLIRQESTDA